LAGDLEVPAPLAGLEPGKSLKEIAAVSNVHDLNHPENLVLIANEIGVKSDAHFVLLVIDRGNQKSTGGTSSP